MYEGTDQDGAPLVVLLLNERASADPRCRTRFDEIAQRAMMTPGDRDLPLSYDANARRPWIASHQEPGWQDAARLLPALEALPVPAAPPAPTWQPPVQQPPVQQLRQQPLPSPAQTGPGGYAMPPGGSANRNTALIAGIVGMGVVLLVAIVTIPIVLAGGDSSGTAAPAATATTSRGTTTTSSAAPTTSPDLDLPATEPTLRDLPPVSLIGPTFGENADTYTMAFPGFPFAFRTPPNWNCLRSDSSPLPDSVLWGCADPDEGQRGQRLIVFLRECPTTCTPAEQEQMNREWLDHPDQAVQSDQSTYFVEYPQNDEGLYAVDFSHFFTQADGQRHWQVGVYLASPHDSRDQTLMVLNDIRSQTP